MRGTSVFDFVRWGVLRGEEVQSPNLGVLECLLDRRPIMDNVGGDCLYTRKIMFETTLNILYNIALNHPSHVNKV